MNDPAPAIQIDDLTYAYGRAEAVRHLNLSVRSGRCYGLFGRNGAGKTTTMKCLLNLLRPQSGQSYSGMNSSSSRSIGSGVNVIGRRRSVAPVPVALHGSEGTSGCRPGI